VALLAMPARFEQLSEKEDGFGYLLGVRIIKREDGERDRYAAYLGTLESQQRRTPERRQTQTATALAGPNNMAQMGAWENLTPAAVGTAFEKFLREKTRSRKS
jgi:hypothetical protein